MTAPLQAGSALRLRIGLSAGRVSLAYLGGLFGRWEMLVSGEPLAQVGAAESLIDPGGVALAPQAWNLVSRQVQAEALPIWGYRLLGLAAEAAPAAAPQTAETPPPNPVSPQASFRAYLPGAILSRITAGQAGWLSELRRVSVLFVNLPDFGLLVETAEALEQAQQVMRALQSALYRYEGSINKLNVDEKGVTLLAVLGLPPMAHEDDPQRAVLAALAMRQALEPFGMRAAIGVASGRAFCGSVGTAQRREYTVIGSRVNLAARLMQIAGRAPQGILCDQPTCDQAQGRVEFAPLPPVQVRGWREPVAIAAPLAEKTRAQRRRLALTGRNAERQVIYNALHHLRAGAPVQVIVLEAEPGMGKSRLVDDALHQAAQLGIPGLLGAADSIEKNTLYLAWRGIFSSLLNLDGETLSENPAQKIERLHQALEPYQYPSAPLLKAVLPGLEIEETAYTQSLSGKTRSDLTQDLLLSLLQSSMLRLPKLLVLDDAHWLDSASWALLWRVCQEVRPLLLFVATRPLPGAPGAEQQPDSPRAIYRRMLELPETTQLKLNEMGWEDIHSLLCQRLGADELQPEVVDFIQQRAGGNPFFSEELGYALRESGWLALENGVARLSAGVNLQSLPLPDTVEGIITSRIDSLPPVHQLTLKVASVIGRVFDYRTLRRIHPVENDHERLLEYLETLQRLDLTPLEAPEPDLVYIFKHVITQEVAYNLLPYARRRSLHQAVARWYESEYASNLEPYYAVLAYHWQAAGEVQPAAHWYQKAGDQSLDMCVFSEAFLFYSRALALLGGDEADFESRSDEAGLSQIAQLLCSAGQALWSTGEYGRAGEYLQRAEALARRLKLVDTLARSLHSRTRLALDTGHYQQALQLTSETLAMQEQINDPRVRVQIFLYIGYAQMRQGNYDESIAIFERGLALARKSGDLAGEGRLLNTLGLSTLYNHNIPAAIHYFERYLEIARFFGHQRDLSIALMNLGESQYWLGNYPRARQLLAEGAGYSRRIGDRLSLSISSALLGVICIALEDEPAAARYFSESLRIARQIQVTTWHLYALGAAASLLARRGHLRLAALAIGLVDAHPASNQENRTMMQKTLERLRADPAFSAPGALEALLAAGGQHDLEELTEAILAIFKPA